MSLAVIIPTRNMAATLGRAIESAQAADEIIVIDDASEDDTCEVVKGFQGVRYVRHREKSKCHNAAQREVWLSLKTDQVVGLAADDWLYPGAIEAMKSCADAPAVFMDIDTFDENGRFLNSYYQHFYGRKSAQEVRERMSGEFRIFAESGAMTAIRTDMARWLWAAGWERLGPRMDSVGLAAVAALFGGAYLGVRGGAFTMDSRGSYSRDPNRTMEEVIKTGIEATKWLFSQGLDRATVRNIATSRCTLTQDTFDGIF